jgi:mannosyl-3-phosphoglycerate phosphatase
LNSKQKIVVFSDLDGTLLNAAYESTETEPILQSLLNFGVSVVLASSKTRAEIAYYRKKWHITDPYIAENGSDITILLAASNQPSNTQTRKNQSRLSSASHMK